MLSTTNLPALLSLVQPPSYFSRYAMRSESVKNYLLLEDRAILQKSEIFSVCVCVELHRQLKSTEVPSDPRSLPPWTANPQINCR